MRTIRHLRLGHRVVGGLTLLLLLALGNILSARQTLRLDAQMTGLAVVARPSVKLVHELTALVDEVQGLAALHLALGGGPELTALEARLRNSRQALDRRLAAWQSQGADDADRRHCAAVKASLAEFRVEQDKLLALSRLTQRDPAALALARAQLNGPSQQAFLHLTAALEAWWAFNDQRVGLAAQQAHADVDRAMALLAMLAAMILVLVGVCVLLVRRSITRPLAQAGAGVVLADSRPLAAIFASIEGMALKSQLLALSAAVEAARPGASGGGIAGVADDARNLASCAAAAVREIQALAGCAGEGLAADTPADCSVQATVGELPAQPRQSGALECDLHGEWFGEFKPADRLR